MHSIYRLPLIFSLFFCSFLTNGNATSKLYVKEATVVIKNGRPCVYIQREKYSDRPVEGMYLWARGSESEIWKSDDIIPSNIENCLLIGGEDYQFKTPWLYTVSMGSWPGAVSYAQADFCLASDDKGNYFLSKWRQGICINEPEEPPKPKMWWQKLFD